MAQTSLNSTGVASTGALSLQSNGTTEAIGISTGQVATLAQNPVLTSGAANGVGYLNGSKVLTTGSALTFDGSNLTATAGFLKAVNASGSSLLRLNQTGTSNGLYISTDASFNTIYNASGASGYAHIWQSADVEQMRLTPTGLGIGTSSPNAKLEVTAAGPNGILLNGAAGYTTNLTLKTAAANGSTQIVLREGGTPAQLSWMVGSNYNANGTFEITPSTTVGGTTFSTPALVINSSGNLGLGVTPSASTLPTIQSTYGVFSGNTNINIINNAYYSGGWKYVGTGLAAQYQQDTGKHIWYTASSGTAGNAISFTQAMTLDASGRLMVGTTGTVIAPITAQATNVNGYGLGIINDATNNTGKLDFLSVSNGGFTRIIGDGRATGYIAFQTNDTERARIDSSGNLIHSAPTTPPSLATNGTMVFNLTSNTNLRVSVRGSDGVTRTANLTLA